MVLAFISILCPYVTPNQTSYCNMVEVKTKSVIPLRPEWPGWEYFADANDGVHVFCLLCASEEKEKTYKVKEYHLIHVNIAYDDDK